VVFGFLEGAGLGSFSGSVSEGRFLYLGCLSVGFWVGAEGPIGGYRLTKVSIRAGHVGNIYPEVLWITLKHVLNWTVIG